MSAPQWDRGQESAFPWIFDDEKQLYYWLKAGRDGKYRKVYQDLVEQGVHQGGSSSQKDPRTVPVQSSKESDGRQKPASSGKRLDPDSVKVNQGKGSHRKEKEYYKEGSYNKARDAKPLDYPDTNTSQSINPTTPLDDLEDHGEASITNTYPEESTYSDDTEGIQYPDQSNHEGEGLVLGVGSLSMNEVEGEGNYTSRPRQTKRETEPPPNQRNNRHTRAKKDTSKGKSQAIEGARYATVPQTSQRYIPSTPGDVEPLDAAYKRRSRDWKKFFEPGRVFSTLWTDPAGDVRDSEASQYMSIVAYGELVHSKIRRFVVVRQDDRCCTCLPITTYSNRGFLKPKIDLSHHGLIYGSDIPPGAVQGITKRPLKVKLAPIGELGNPSYINYGRPYTIDCNVKVKNVGDLDSDSRKLLRRYCNEVNFSQEDDGSAALVYRPQDNVEDLTGVGSGMMAPYPPTMQAPNLHYQNLGYQYGGGAGFSSEYSQQQGYNQPASGWPNSVPMGQTGYPTYATQSIYNQNFQGQAGTPNSMQSNAALPPSTPTPLGRSQSYASHQHQDNRFSQDHSTNTTAFTESLPIREQSLHRYHSSVSSQGAPQRSSPITPFPSPPVASSQDYSQNSAIDASQGSTTSEHTDSYVDQEHSAPDESNNQGAAPWTSETPALQTTVSHEEAVAEDEVDQEEIKLVTLKEAQEQKRHRQNSAGGKSTKTSSDKKKKSGHSRK